MAPQVDRRTRIEADPDLPVIRTAREFEAPAEAVYRAWTDPELLTRWLGPGGSTMRVEEWNAATGGHYRYSEWESGERVATFYGSFHELRPNERLVQTFAYDGQPDTVFLETITFEEPRDGITRVVTHSIVDSAGSRDAMASAMAPGVEEGYAKLDALLAGG